MTYTISGACHCGNLTYQLSTQTPPSDVLARACDCGFCRMHAARTWSDPKGNVTIRVGRDENLQRYRFARRTADFYLCRICGAYLGAVIEDAEGAWSTVNLRLTEHAVRESPASYGSEDTAQRIRRRKGAWTPTTVKIDVDNKHPESEREMERQLKHYRDKLAYETDSWDLKVALEGNENVVVIDTRSPEAYAAEHIPRAINIPHRHMNPESTARLDKSALLVTYCDGIGCNASTKGALALTKLGFEVKELMGGLDWWKRDGHQTASGGRK